MPDGARAKQCWHCKRPYTKAQMKERLKTKGQRVSEALQMAKSLGEPVGRPMKVDQEKVREMKRAGMRTKDVASQLNCSIRSVQRIMKL